jgi:CheY-like chemotaxis protein
MVKKMVENGRGRIEVSSPCDVGSTFTVYFPQETPYTDFCVFAASSSIVFMIPLSCVMLVDDDTTTNYLNQRLLDRLGVAKQVLVAQDGRQALTLITSNCQPNTPMCPALILLDLNMPGMNGFEFLAAYRQLAAAQPLESIIVVLSSSLYPLDVQRTKEFAVNGYLSKPLTAEKVQQILQQHFAPQ